MQITVFRKDPSDHGGHFRRVTHTYPFPGLLVEPPQDSFKPFPNPITAQKKEDWVYMEDFFENLVGPGKETCFVHLTLFSPEHRLMFKVSAPNRRVMFISSEGMVIQEKPTRSILDQAFSLAQSLKDRLTSASNPRG